MLYYFLGVVFLLGAAVGGFFVYNIYINDDLVFRYKVSIPDPRSGKVRVEGEISNISKHFLLLRQFSSWRYMRMSNFRIIDEDGNELPSRWYGWKRFVWVGMRKKIKLVYDIKPGANGRHGHQGYVDERFALLQSAHLFYAPWPLTHLKDFKVQFIAPPGWKAIHPWDEKNGWADPRIDGKLLTNSLYKSTLGFGRFQSTRKNIGGNIVEAHLWDGWPPDYKKRLQDKIFKIFKTFHELLKFRLKNRFIVIYTPRGKDRKGIIAGYWGNGQGNQMGDSPHEWRLFAHRIAHVFDRDKPYGWTHAYNAKYHPWTGMVNWINEGLTTFLENWAVYVSGVSEDDSHFMDLYRSYIHRTLNRPDHHKRKKHQKHKTQYNVPVSLEYMYGDHEYTEYNHYYKSPLIIQNLDFYLKKRTKNKKDAAGWFAFMYQKYKNHQKPLPTFKELNRYTGMDWSWFWDRYAVDNDIILPLWDSVFSKYGHRTKPLERIASLDGMPVYGDQAYERLKGYGSRFKDELNRQRTRLIRTALITRELQKRRADPIPTELREIEYNLPSDLRHMVELKRERALARLLSKKLWPSGRPKLESFLMQLRQHSKIEWL